jgi:gliding motility-associated-like protein
MKKRYRYAACVAFLCSATAAASYAQLTVTANQTAAALAQNLAGTGVTVLNANLTCAGAANGTFTATASNLGITNGIVLTTGQATAVAGAEAGLTSFNNNTTGDPALQTLSGASTTKDACILQFDLVPKGDTIKFDYVFGSEEYINSICGPYNDAFAFFISGPGITGTVNMARVPGTGIPVAVNSINTGIPGLYGALPNCTAMGPGAPFTAYYNNNTGGATVAYRGLTTVLTAAHMVTPCDTYHLKLTVADAVNGLYDSGVFIKAGSLQSTTFGVDIAAPMTIGGLPAIYKGCTPATLTFSRSVIKPTPQTLTYQVAGTAVNGTDYATLPGSVVIPANTAQTTLTITGLTTPPAGMKTLKLYLNSPYSCTGTAEIVDSIELHLFDAPAATIITPDTAICAGNSIQLRVNGDNSLQYNWTPATGLNNASLKEPYATPAATTTYQMTADIPGSGCTPITGTVEVSIFLAPAFTDAGADVLVCEHTPVSIVPDINPDDASFSYEWNGPGGFSFPGKTLSLPDPLVTNSGYYHFTVSSALCGAASDSVLINVVEFPSMPVVGGPLTVCLNEVIKSLPVDGKDLKWYKSATGPDAYDRAPGINTSSVGTFDFYVTQRLGNCESERAKLTVTVERCCDDYIFIPTAFTPNRDGMNDYFDIAVRNGTKVTRIAIFNRWGQPVYERNNGLPWDGTFNGQPVELGNYYYHLEVTCKDGTQIRKKGEVLVVK